MAIYKPSTEGEGSHSKGVTVTEGQLIQETHDIKGSIIAGTFFFSSRRRHTRLQGDWSSDVCSSDLPDAVGQDQHGPVGDADGLDPLEAIDDRRRHEVGGHVEDIVGGAVEEHVAHG